MSRPGAEAVRPRHDCRVLVLRDHLRWSGGTLYMADLLHRLRARGIDPDLCVLGPAADDPGRGPALPVRPTHLARSRRDRSGGLRFLAEIRRHTPDVVLLSGPRAMLAGRLAAAACGVPAVVLFNNALPEPRLQRALQRPLGAVTARGIAVSEATARWASAAYGLPSDRIRVLHHVPDLSPFRLTPERRAARRQAMRATLGIPAEARVIVLAGRVVDWQKGQFGTIEVLADLRAAHPDAHLLIAGDGPDLAGCRARAVDLGIDDAVTLAGFRTDMPDILAAADVAVVPSRVEEAFGYTAIEAAAAGLPVVAFAAGGLPEALRDGQTGHLVPREDWPALGAALARCLSDPAHAARLGAAGRAFSQGFTPDTHADGVAVLLREVVRGDRPTGPARAQG